MADFGVYGMMTDAPAQQWAELDWFAKLKQGY